MKIAELILSICYGGFMVLACVVVYRVIKKESQPPTTQTRQSLHVQEDEDL